MRRVRRVLVRMLRRWWRTVKHEPFHRQLGTSYWVAVVRAATVAGDGVGLDGVGLARAHARLRRRRATTAFLGQTCRVLCCRWQIIQGRTHGSAAVRPKASRLPCRGERRAGFRSWCLFSIFSARFVRRRSLVSPSPCFALHIPRLVHSLHYFLFS